jgi:hypothetical protein
MNIEELVLEAVENIKTEVEGKGDGEQLDIPVATNFLQCEEFKKRIINLISISPSMQLGIIVDTLEHAATIRVMLTFAFECGRLYGRSEVVEETLKEYGGGE